MREACSFLRAHLLGQALEPHHRASDLIAAAHEVLLRHCQLQPVLLLLGTRASALANDIAGSSGPWTSHGIVAQHLSSVLDNDRAET
eukprot:3392006-Rhodomonas_salina.3